MAKAKDEKKEKEIFIVAPGFSFVGKKRTYAAGDEITEAAFANVETFKAHVTSKPPKIIKSLMEIEPENKTGAPGDGGGGAGAGADERKKLEEALIGSGLGTAEFAAALSLEELKKTLQDAGIK